MSIEEIYRRYVACGGVVTTDSRAVKGGEMFIALKGENFDGNAYAAKALEAGAACAVVNSGSEAGKSGDPRIIAVEDTFGLLKQLANHHRHHCLGERHLPVLGLTGTNGKTTTKELIRAVLSRKYNIVATEGNLNNDIGVPLSLLKIRPDTEMAVVEMGANHPDDIKHLVEVVEPGYGLITNVGRAHLEGFGSFEGVIATKTELYTFLRQKKEGFIFLHGDNENLVPKSEGLKSIKYGSAGHDYCVEGEVVECNPFVKMRWRSKNEKTWHEVQTQLIGTYNIDNMLAAAAVGLHFGVTPEQVDHALNCYAPHLGRSELKRTERNTLIVDAYNANLTSMNAALDNFRQIPAPHKMAVLGEMRELGAASAEAHQQVMEKALTLGLEKLWLVGEEMSKLANEQISKLTNVTEVRFFHNVEEVKAELADTHLTDFLILIKGSNGTHLYELPESL